MRTLLVFLALLVAIIGGIIAFNQYNKKHDDLRKQTADFQIQASALFQAFSGNEQKANELYLNKIIEVSGTVGKIESSPENNAQLFLETDDPMFGIICDLAPEEKVDELKAGDPVIIRGICSGFLMDVALNRCVIIK